MAFIGGLASFLIFVILLYINIRNITYVGFTYWTSASLVAFFGLMMLSMRNKIPEFFSIILANSLILITFLLITWGMIRFSGLTWKKDRLLAVPVLIQTVLFLFFTYIDNNVDARIVVLSLFIIVYLLISLKISIHHIYRGRDAINWPMTVIFGLLVLINVIRIVYTVTNNVDSMDFMQYPSFQSLTMLVIAFGVLSFFFEVIILNFQRVESDLNKSLEEIKTLRGLLPICSFCKKIKDSEGYWNQLEKYISEHSEATFSHGVCDECMSKYYSKYIKKDSDQ